MITDADAWAARCEVCARRGPLAGCAAEAHGLATKDGWRSRIDEFEKRWMTCPGCAPSKAKRAATKYATPLDLRCAAIAALKGWGTAGCIASNLGQDLWGGPGPSNAARFARQAGKLLKAMLREGLVTRESPNDRSPIWRVR